MVEHYRRGTAAERHAVFDAYLEHLEYINNWDLVDSSAEHIVGPQVSVDNLSLLERLAASGHLWTRRVALLATLALHFHPYMNILALMGSLRARSINTDLLNATALLAPAGTLLKP